MTFGKIKLKRCKKCKYYKRLGQHFHFCGYDKYYSKHPMDYETGDIFWTYKIIPLICFRKERINEQ